MGYAAQLCLVIAVTLCIDTIKCFIQYHKVFEKATNLSNTSSTDVDISMSLEVGSAGACARECAQDRDCVTFVYNSQTGSCYVLASNLNSAPSSARDQGWMFYTFRIDGSGCEEILENDPAAKDGVYTIDPEDGKGPLQVYCDMTAGDGWTVFQRRVDGSLHFNRTWASYRKGFGNFAGAFWLGNEAIHRLTSARSMKLRVEMLDWEEQTGFAEYSIFKVHDETHNYRLNVAGFTGNRGDSLAYHNNMMFSTMDRDHDTFTGECSTGSGWWFAYCLDSNLNGVYGNAKYGQGINWKTWHGAQYSLKWVEMKMKLT